MTSTSGTVLLAAAWPPRPSALDTTPSMPLAPRLARMRQRLAAAGKEGVQIPHRHAVADVQGGAVGQQVGQFREHPRLAQPVVGGEGFPDAHLRVISLASSHARVHGPTASRERKASAAARAPHSPARVRVDHVGGQPRGLPPAPASVHHHVAAAGPAGQGQRRAWTRERPRSAAPRRAGGTRRRRRPAKTRRRRRRRGSGRGARTVPTTGDRPGRASRGGRPGRDRLRQPGIASGPADDDASLVGRQFLREATAPHRAAGRVPSWTAGEPGLSPRRRRRPPHRRNGASPDAGSPVPGPPVAAGAGGRGMRGSRKGKFKWTGPAGPPGPWPPPGGRGAAVAHHTGIVIGGGHLREPLDVGTVHADLIHGLGAPRSRRLVGPIRGQDDEGHPRDSTLPPPRGKNSRPRSPTCR